MGNLATAYIDTANNTPVDVSQRTPLPVLRGVGAGAGLGVAPVASTVAEGSHVLKASPGNLYAIDVVVGATPGFLMIFNAVAAPVDGAVTPLKCFGVIAANTTLALEFDPPLYCSAGIVVVFSSTGPLNKTVSNTAFFSGQSA